MDKQVSLLSNQAPFTTATDVRNSSDFKFLRMPLNFAFKFELQEGVVLRRMIMMAGYDLEIVFKFYTSIPL